jgi:hypothetical protein
MRARPSGTLTVITGNTEMRGFAYAEGTCRFPIFLTFSLLSCEPLFFTLMRHMAKTYKHKFISRIFCNVIAIGGMHPTAVYHRFIGSMQTYGVGDSKAHHYMLFTPSYQSSPQKI